MIKVWKETIKTFIKNWELMTLLLLPIIALELTNIDFRIKNVLLITFSIAAQFVIFMHLLRPGEVLQKIKDLLFVVKFSLVMLIIAISYYYLIPYSLILVENVYRNLHIRLFIHSISFYFFFLDFPVLLTVCYLFVRLNLILPMLITEEKITFNNIITLSKANYLFWIVLVFTLYFYFPFAIIVEERITAVIRLIPATFFLSCFYSSYYSLKMKNYNFF